ncbi:MAG: hypothetical protein AAF587_34535 [Bacteroidota bacterium]
MKYTFPILLLLFLYSCKEAVVDPDDAITCGKTDLRPVCDPSKALSAPESYQLDSLGHITANSIANNHFLRFHKFQFINEQLGYALTVPPMGESEFFTTTDGGTNWELVEFDSLQDIHNFQFRDEMFGVLAVGINEIAITQNGGFDWQLTQFDGVEGITQSIIMDESDYIFVAIHDYLQRKSTILGSTDGGANWKNLFVHETQRPLSIKKTSETLILYGGFEVFTISFTGRLLQEVKLSSPSDDLYIINEEEWVRLALEGGLYVTRDAGQNWEKIAESQGSYGISGLEGGKIIGFESADKGLFISPVGFCPDEEHGVEECVIFFIDAKEGICEHSETAYRTNSYMLHSQWMGDGKWYMVVGEHLFALEEK